MIASNGSTLSHCFVGVLYRVAQGADESTVERFERTLLIPVFGQQSLLCYLRNIQLVDQGIAETRRSFVGLGWICFILPYDVGCRFDIFEQTKPGCADIDAAEFWPQKCEGQHDKPPRDDQRGHSPGGAAAYDYLLLRRSRSSLSY